MAKARAASITQQLDEAMQRLVDGYHHDPFDILGKHPGSPGKNAGIVIRAILPDARESVLVTPSERYPMHSVDGSILFEWHGTKSAVAKGYQFEWIDQHGCAHLEHDPYRFAPFVGDLDQHLFAEGRHWQIYQVLGAHPDTLEGIPGVRFATWAPGAERVSVVGDFNGWNDRRHPMRVRGGSGIWELFIPDVQADAVYKFSIRTRGTGQVTMKADPYARASEFRPKTGSCIQAQSSYEWQDKTWLAQRANWDWQAAPVSVYEIHLGSWRRNHDGGFLNYRDLAHQLVAYIKPLGFTHIELLPITEHPLDDSWGYQTTGYYAPTSRFGSPDDFRYFVDYLHQHQLGVILDWVPAHFPKDEHGLAHYDGTALYEHEDPRRGEHRDWGTLIYNYGRNEVRNFLLANALYWLEEFHIDGLRVDAVASMLYLDYSREPDDWVANQFGGNENLEAIEFLRELNVVCHGQHPGAMVIAEESTAWPQVTRPTWVGGLGFSMKWNMGWMHDTLTYMSKDPVHRHYHHDQLTFGMMYAFTENFLLPFSHDEVVHGKGSMINKMPGDDWQRFANLRLLYTYLFTYPGAKLLFMGSEFGQWREWNHKEALDWHLLEQDPHRGLSTLVGDLNRLYTNSPPLYQRSFQHDGFEWIDCHDSTQSVVSYLRKSQSGFCIVILNFTPMPRHNYRLGVPAGGEYREAFNSDSLYYGGGNLGNGTTLHTQPVAWMGHDQSLLLTLPPLAGIVLEYV